MIAVGIVVDSRGCVSPAPVGVLSEATLSATSDAIATAPAVSSSKYIGLGTSGCESDRVLASVSIVEGDE